MKRDEPFVDHCLELLAPLGEVRTRRMFGGHGLYLDDLIFALIADEALYMKVDAESRPRFEAAGCAPFVYDAKTKAVAMSYWSAPDDAMESPPAMLPWARAAMDAALRVRARKAAATGKPRKARPKAAPAAATSAAPRRATPERKTAPARKQKATPRKPAR